MSCEGKLTLLESVVVANSLADATAATRDTWFARLARGIVDGTLPPPPIARLIGFRIVTAHPGHAVFELDTDLDRHANAMGTLHGGILCDLADAAMGSAYAGTLAESETFTTVELKINFLRPVWATRLTATGRVVHAGRTIGVVDCDVTDAQGRVVDRASSACLTLRGAMAAGQ